MNKGNPVKVKGLESFVRPDPVRIIGETARKRDAAAQRKVLQYRSCVKKYGSKKIVCAPNGLNEKLFVGTSDLSKYVRMFVNIGKNITFAVYLAR